MQRCWNCQKVTRLYAETVKMPAPVARPSRPSVRFVAFDQATERNEIHTRYAIQPMTAPSARNESIGMSRKNEMNGDAGVCPTRLGKFSATMPKGTATRI